MAHNSVDTSILTSDGQVSSVPGKVYWVLVSAAGTGGAWQLNDSTDDGGTDLVSGVAPASSMTFLRFGSENEGALVFGTAIYADIPGTNVTLTVGYH
jgi:hypothetical protein